MINLLPPETKSGYRYARRNLALRRWVLICLIALVGLGGIATYGLLTLQQSTNRYNKEIATTEGVFERENFDGIQKQVQDISNSFKLVVKVLGQEVLFSQLIKQIGSTIPADANLTGLTITQLGGGIDITANAANYSAASQVQINLADPDNKIFSQADIISITCNATGSDPRYPCTVTIRALFSPNNPFLFINSQAQAAKP